MGNMVSQPPWLSQDFPGTQFRLWQPLASLLHTCIHVSASLLLLSGMLQWTPLWKLNCISDKVHEALIVTFFADLLLARAVELFALWDNIYQTSNLLSSVLIAIDSPFISLLLKQFLVPSQLFRLFTQLCNHNLTTSYLSTGRLSKMRSLSNSDGG